MNDDKTVSRDMQEATARKSDPDLKRVGVYVLAAALIFLAGFVPMWLQAGARLQERDTAQRELRLVQVQVSLASATIDARRGEYEPARQAAAAFFKALTEESDLGKGSVLTPQHHEALQPLTLQRDEIITLLARGDPASAERLANLYVAYRTALRK